MATTTATITWQTTLFSTSKVIYDILPDQFDIDAGPPSYGYAFYKEGDDSGKEKVTFHKVTLTDLTPGITYYYRTVSQASPPVFSPELAFTTSLVPGEEVPVPEEEEIPEEEVEEEVEEEEEVPEEEEIVPEVTPGEEVVPEGEEEEEEVEEEIKPEEEEAEEAVEEEITEEEEERIGFGANMLAAIGNIFGSIYFKIILAVILAIAVILLLREVFLGFWRKRRKK